ncbi:hypothetical protein BdWA1_000539 [Babesia duncani]|uniref:Uncharacterized protein n=1 Tax=Babesia duncani TaxID=323732 RepID=A0AAD9PNA1_9APIC|nr:hypothetical protein BdWA1_000539 [Babesia duncani]
MLQVSISTSVEYPQEEGKSASVDLNTEAENLRNRVIKTPVIIISPKHLVDYERLYKKMLDKQIHIGEAEAFNGSSSKNIEKEALYNSKITYSDPVSRRDLLYEMLKEAKAKLAFYRADLSHMELLLASNVTE